MNSCIQTGLAHLIFFNLHSKIAAVYQSDAVTGTGHFCCRRLTKYNEWIMMMAGCPAYTSNLHNPMDHRNTFHLTLHAVTAMEMHQFPVSVHQIQIHGHCFFQYNIPFSLIDQSNTSGDNIPFFPDAVIQYSSKPCRRILHLNLKSIRIILITIESRHTGNGILTFRYAV